MGIIFLPQALASTSNNDEIPAARQFAAEYFGNLSQAGSTLPFSFVYGGKSSSTLLPEWKKTRTCQQLDEHRQQFTVTYTDPATGLEVRCVSVVYQDFPTVEWTVYFQNTGSEPAPILEKVYAMDVSLTRTGKQEYVLHYHKGSQTKITDFQPCTAVLNAASTFELNPGSGRPTSGVLSYFNLEEPGEIIEKTALESAIYRRVETEQMPGRGLIIAVGWPGYWEAQFLRDDQNGLRILSGQKEMACSLEPGELIRTPLIAVQHYAGDTIDGQNVWRQWMIKHNLPRDGQGKLIPAALAACSSHQFAEMVKANTENQIHFVERYAEEKLGIAHWWMDAGWYKMSGNRWTDTGTWEIDPNRFPKGFRPISDRAHDLGIKIIVWFEPERVAKDSWLWNQRPQWLLTTANPPEEYYRDWKLLNLGNLEAVKWLTNHVDAIIKKEGIDLYRQDFNMDPLSYWRTADKPGRIGITENKYIQGYLQYWDELRCRNNNMFIDSCSSGGNRNDLETLRRAVPFLRSDYLFEETGQQCQTYALSQWWPYHGTGTLQVNAYHFWSNAIPHIIACWDIRDKNLNYEALRKWLGSWRQISRYYNSDYYPLTPYSLSPDAWMAWQFNDKEKAAGMVQAFRRPESYIRATDLKLRGLEANASYQITELLSGKTWNVKGSELMTQGIVITIEQRPGTVVIEYKKMP